MTHRVLLLAFSGICLAAQAHEGTHNESRNQTTTGINEVRILVRGDHRIIEANGIPDHTTGAFPNRGNPNTIRAQRHSFRIPLNPRIAPEVTPLGMNPFGVAVNGVPFDPGAAEFWRNDRRSGWQYEALSGHINLGIDLNHAHVQPTGAYHYHGLPVGLIEKLEKKSGPMVLIGYAADGFPIYGPFCFADANDPQSPVRKLASSHRIKAGMRPSGPGGPHDGTFVQDYEFVAGLGDLDECNGRTGVTPEYPDGTYYYVLTDAYPFIPRAFRGAPDESFLRHGPPGGRPPFGPPGSRPPPPGRRPPQR